MHLYTASIKPFPARTVRCYVYNRKARPFFLIYTYHNATEHTATLGYVVSCNSRTSIRSAVGTFFYIRGICYNILATHTEYISCVHHT